MSAWAEQIAKQAVVVTSAESNLKAATDRYNKVKGLGGQQGYNVTIDGVTLAVANMDRYYVTKLIRGREMIHLGALKALDADIDQCRARVKTESAKLAVYAERLAGSLRGEA